MQSSSHRIFNITVAADLLVCCPKHNLTETLIIAAGTILCSSLPDTIEKLGLKHRGMSHSLVLYFCLFTLTYLTLVLFPQFYWEYFCLFGIFIGCMGHVIADACSKHGIKIFNWSLKLNLYRTGSYSEKLFLYVFVLINTLLMSLFI